jgi:hypothetical protein
MHDQRDSEKFVEKAEAAVNEKVVKQATTATTCYNFFHIASFILTVYFMPYTEDIRLSQKSRFYRLKKP